MRCLNGRAVIFSQFLKDLDTTNIWRLVKVPRVNDIAWLWGLPWCPCRPSLPFSTSCSLQRTSPASDTQRSSMRASSPIPENSLSIEELFSHFPSAGDTQNLRCFHLYATSLSRVFFVFMSPLLTPEILDAKRCLFQHFWECKHTHTHTF